MFLLISGTLLVIASGWMILNFNQVMNTRYGFEVDKLKIICGKSENELSFDQIDDLQLEKDRIFFKDPSGKRYFIPRDFEDFDEIYKQFSNIKR